MRRLDGETALLEAQGFGPGGARLFVARVAGFDHQGEDVGLAGLSPREVGQGVVPGRRLRQAGQQAGLGQVQVARRLAEVGLCGCLDAVGQVAVVDLVQVQLQDLVLAQVARQPKGEDGFTQLTLDALGRALLRRQVKVAHELLGDGAAAGHHFAGAQVLDQGAPQGEDIEAGVAVETGVLGGDGGLAQGRGDLLEAEVGVRALLRQGHLV